MSKSSGKRRFPSVAKASSDATAVGQPLRQAVSDHQADAKARREKRRVKLGFGQPSTVINSCRGSQKKGTDGFGESLFRFSLFFYIFFSFPIWFVKGLKHF